MRSIETHLLVPVKFGLGQLVRLGLLEESRLQLRINILKLLKRGLLRHLDRFSEVQKGSKSRIDKVVDVGCER